MNKRVNISSGSEFETAFGYSRLVKVGDVIYVSGTTGYDYEKGHIDPNPVVQFHQLIHNIETALVETGSGLGDIVQMTTYVNAQEVFDEIAPELGKVFGQIRPTNTALIVQFPLPDIKIEISTTAIINCGN